MWSCILAFAVGFIVGFIAARAYKGGIEIEIGP